VLRTPAGPRQPQTRPRGGHRQPVPGHRPGPLSYRRAAELFEISTRRLAHADATAAKLAGLNGWNLHQLRQSMLTHEAENGTSTPTQLARSRHERNVRPGPEAVARHVAATDPAARRRPPGR
jgi:integrase/recombinase XerD